MPTIDIRDEVTPALARVTEALERRAKEQIATAVAKMFRAHFAALPDNKHGWPSTGFWADAARSVNHDVLADGVAINVNKQGVRQRLQGGVIEAKPGSFLTIPARAEAYGKRAREFANLKIVFFKNCAALVEAESQDVSLGRKRKDGSRKVKAGTERGGGVMFWLVKSVRQAANPDVIPSAEAITAECVETVNALVDRAMQRGSA